jgi:ankyrin repeat protein
MPRIAKVGMHTAWRVQWATWRFVRKLSKDARVARMSFALVMACRAGHLDIARELLKDASVDVNAVNALGDTPLILASQEGHAKVVSELLKQHKLDVNANNDSGKTALMSAIEVGRTEFAQYIEGHEGEGEYQE